MVILGASLNFLICLKNNGKMPVRVGKLKRELFKTNIENNDLLCQMTDDARLNLLCDRIYLVNFRGKILLASVAQFF